MNKPIFGMVSEVCTPIYNNLTIYLIDVRFSTFLMKEKQKHISKHLINEQTYL